MTDFLLTKQDVKYIKYQMVVGERLMERSNSIAQAANQG
jgi:hypothetical protein